MTELLLVIALLAGPGEKVKGLDAATRTALQAGPWTITSVPPPAAGLHRNDYYSEAPYWWPDPKDPKAPFLRRDGETYPQRFDKHRRLLGEMGKNLLALGLRASLLADKQALRKGEDVARVWFLNEQTRMNPHLEYGQAIRNRNTGRGAGIIDTRVLIWAVEGVRQLEAAGAFTAAERAALRAWFSDYTRWLTGSELGRTEGLAKNNHGTWWTAQVLAFAHYTGDRATRERLYGQVKERMIPGQIRADGSCPLEEARTRSLSYSAMNLDGWTVLATLAERDGVSLWDYKSGGSGSIREAIRYVAPYVAAPANWKKQQISRFDAGNVLFVALERGARGERAEAITGLLP
jgi:hypothetical protein